MRIWSIRRGQAHLPGKQPSSLHSSLHTYIFTLPFRSHLLLNRGQQCLAGLLRRLLLPSFPPSIACSSRLRAAIGDKGTTNAST